MERARGENFPVALRVLPADPRRHLLAIYGFARLCDELGDAAEGDRLALARRARGRARARLGGQGDPSPAAASLEPTLAELSLPRQPFLDLIEANRRDQRVSRYESWEALRGYCALSANPVGRLVLCVFESDTAGRRLLSDTVCTALQLVEHCQDVAEDFAAGRVYLPAEDLARFGCGESELAAPRIQRAPARRAALGDRTREGAAPGRHPPGGLAARFGAPRRGGLRRWWLRGGRLGGAGGASTCSREPPRTRRRDLLRHLIRVLWRARSLRGAGGLQ